MRLAVALAIVAACGDDTGGGASTSTSAGGVDAGGAGAGAAGAGGIGGQPSSGGGGDGGEGGNAAPAPTRAFVYVGTQQGQIERYELNRDTGALTSLGATPAGQNPSFLAASPDHTHLYAADESQSQIVAFRIDPSTGALTHLNEKSSAGQGPAYVSVDATGKWVFTGNYGGGTVGVLPVLPDGSLGDAVDQESPGTNPHWIRADTTNDHVYVPCLGSNHVARFDFDDDTGALTEIDPPAPLANGTGPRHLDFHPTLPVLYVIGELNDTISTFQSGNGAAMTLSDTDSTLPVGFDPNANTCADLHVHPNGKFLYGSNRGHDSIAVFAIDESGAITPTGHAPTGGQRPRNFGIDPEGSILLVANQDSDEIVTFGIDPVTGALTELQTTPTGNGPSWVGVITQPL